MGLDFSVVAPYAGLLATGLWWTVVLTVCAGLVSFFMGILFAVIVLYAPASPPSTSARRKALAA